MQDKTEALELYFTKIKSWIILQLVLFKIRANVMLILMSVNQTLPTPETNIILACPFNLSLRVFSHFDLIRVISHTLILFFTFLSFDIILWSSLVS